ncbi:MAG: hypothetical protein KGQ41_07360 [Alphaproteobacteria bacterium]|nr:hypothetical protein [Alphaproteobacteria bacterium]
MKQFQLAVAGLLAGASIFEGADSWVTHGRIAAMRQTGSAGYEEGRMVCIGQNATFISKGTYTHQVTVLMRDGTRYVGLTREKFSDALMLARSLCNAQTFGLKWEVEGGGFFKKYACAGKGGRAEVVFAGTPAIRVQFKGASGEEATMPWVGTYYRAEKLARDLCAGDFSPRPRKAAASLQGKAPQ